MSITVVEGQKRWNQTWYRKMMNDPVLRDARRVYKRNWTRNNPFYLKMRNAKSRASRTKIKFTLTIRQFRSIYEDQKGLCALSGRKMLFNTSCLNSLSFDRIKPEEGYVFGNVRLVTWQINSARAIGSDEDLVSLCRDVLRWHSRSGVIRKKSP